MRIYKKSKGFWGFGFGWMPYGWFLDIGPWCLTTDSSDEWDGI